MKDNNVVNYIEDEWKGCTQDITENLKRDFLVHSILVRRVGSIIIAIQLVRWWKAII